MYIWVKQFDHSKILHKTCWAHLGTTFGNAGQGFSTWTCGWAQRLVSTKPRYQMIPLSSFVHRRKSYRYDMIQSLPWLPTVSLVLCGRFYLRHFTEFHSVPCWSYFVCLCVCVQVLKKEKSLSKRTVWRIWSPKLSSLRDFKILQIQLLFCQDAFSGKLRFDTGSWWQVVKYTVRHSVQDRVRSGIVWDRIFLLKELFEIVCNYQTNVLTHEHRGRFKIARHGAWVTAFNLDKMCFPQADVPVTDTVEADEVAEAPVFFLKFFSTMITVAPSCNNCNNRNDNDDDQSDKVVPLLKRLKADLRFQGETPSDWFWMFWEIEIIYDHLRSSEVLKKDEKGSKSPWFFVSCFGEFGDPAF